MDALVDILRANEDDVVTRVFAAAHQHGYTRYSSTLIEAWRVSVRGLTDALVSALRAELPLDPDMEANLASDPVTAFGRDEALKHRSRGVTLSMFLGLTKHYRESFADSCAQSADPAEAQRRRHVITRLFDRIELGFCDAWSRAEQLSGASALEETNRLLANEKNRYLTVLESIRESVFVVSTQGEVLYANPPALKVAAVDSALGGARYGQALQSLNAAKPGWLDDLVREAPTEPTSVLAALDGQPHTFVARVTPVLDVTDRNRGVVVVLKDLTELKKVDRERRELQAVFDAVASCASDGIVMVGETGRIEFWNRAAERIFGWPREEAVGKDPHELLTSGVPRVSEHLSKGRLPGPRSFRARRRDGSEVEIELALSAVRSGSGRQMLAVVRDITERRRLESQAHASSRLEAVGRLAAGIAHEINTPVQFVGDSLHFLHDAAATLCTLTRELSAHAAELPPGPWAEALPARLDELDVPYLLEEVPRAVDRAIEGVGRVADIVRAMKEFGHPGNRRMARADLNRAVRNTLIVSRSSWKYVATADVEACELPPVLCHIEQLSQVLLNLVVNAGDAIRERHAEGASGRITLRTRVEGRFAVIEVEDTGVGIPAAAQPVLFQPFFTTKPPGQGTGQGLALAHHIVVETHGGSLTFRTTLGVGTVFSVRVPIDGPAQSAANENELERSAS